MTVLHKTVARKCCFTERVPKKSDLPRVVLSGMLNSAETETASAVAAFSAVETGL